MNVQREMFTLGNVTLGAIYFLRSDLWIDLLRPGPRRRERQIRSECLFVFDSSLRANPDSLGIRCSRECLFQSHEVAQRVSCERVSCGRSAESVLLLGALYFWYLVCLCRYK